MHWPDWKHVHEILTRCPFVRRCLHLISERDFRTCYWKINPPPSFVYSRLSVNNSSIGLLVLQVPICLVSVIGAWVSIDFTFAKFNSCRWSEGPATAHWYFRQRRGLNCRGGRDAMELIVLMRLPISCLSCSPILQGCSGQTGWRLQHEIIVWVWLVCMDGKDRALFVYGRACVYHLPD